MSRFDAVIFDMDGVLIDSEPLHFAVLVELLGTVGYVYSRAENERYLGVTSEACFSDLIARHGLPGSVAEYMARYDAGVLRVLQRPHPPADGVVALLQRLRQLHVAVAVASSSQRLWVMTTLQSLGLRDAFGVIVAGDDVSRGKPDPAIYLLAAQRLEITPERCLAVEDSPNGVQSARAAGMTVLGVRTEYTAHLQLEGVVRTVDTLAELTLDGDLVL